MTALWSWIQLLDDFQRQFDSGEFPGWHDKGISKPPVTHVADVIDLEAFADVEELESVGKFVFFSLSLL